MHDAAQIAAAGVCARAVHGERGEIVAPRDYDGFGRKVSVMRRLRGE